MLSEKGFHGIEHIPQVSIIMSLASEISSGESRALVDVDVAAVALPRVGALAKESAAQIWSQSWD